MRKILIYIPSPSTDAERVVMEDYPFRSAVSSLMFAMVTMRADICYAVISVARFTANPGLSHWHALVRIFQYIKGTNSKGGSICKFNSTFFQ